MGVGIGNIGRTMGGPAGVTDPDLTGQRVVHQQVRQVDQLANGAAAVKFPVLDGCNPGAVIAAILKPLEGLNQNRRNLVLAQNPDDTAHQIFPLSRFAFLAFSRSINLRAMPALTV